MRTFSAATLHQHTHTHSSDTCTLTHTHTHTHTNTHTLTLSHTQLEATGRTFSAATLYQHTHAQLNPLSAVALLQLAQGLLDTAAEVCLPPAYQPLPLQVCS
jgi:hypothetical protein